MFHLQQDIEKMLKAAISHHRIEISRTHDIERLIAICRESGIDLPDYTEHFDDLSFFAVDGRYALIHDDICDAEVFLKESDNFQKFIGDLLGII